MERYRALKVHRTCGRVVDKATFQHTDFCFRCNRHLQADDVVEYVPASQLEGAVGAIETVMGILHADSHGGPRDHCSTCAEIRRRNNLPGGR